MATEVKILVIFEGKAMKEPAGMLEIFYTSTWVVVYLVTCSHMCTFIYIK